MLQLSLDFFGQQLDRFRTARPAARTRIGHSVEWKHGIIVHVVFPPRARRYLLSLRPDGTARLVIPRRGTEVEGMRFLERSEEWLLQRIAQWRSRSESRQPWIDGATFLYRGEDVTLQVEKTERSVRLSFSDQVVMAPRELPDYREVISAHLRRMAERELPARTRELALQYDITVRRVTVRAQKTRWGSCSARGTISLNWRLVHAPSHVVDYLIVHELMHRREMNHSKRYWKLVAEAFPDYRRAEAWLKSSRLELRS